MMKNTTSQCVGKIQSVHAGQNPVLTTTKEVYESPELYTKDPY